MTSALLPRRLPRWTATLVLLMPSAGFGSVVGEEAVVAIGNASGCGPGTVEVRYVSGPSLDSFSHLIHFVPQAPIAADAAGRPRCAPLAALAAEQATFAFEPDQCAVGADCDAVRVQLRDVPGPFTSPNGTPLYRCDIDPAPSAEVGSYPLGCTDAVARNGGIPDLVGVCRAGSFTLGGCESSSPTPSATPPETATRPPADPTETPTIDSPAPGSGEGGCAVTQESNGGAWPLLGALLVWSAGHRRRILSARRCSHRRD